MKKTEKHISLIPHDIIAASTLTPKRITCPRACSDVIPRDPLLVRLNSGLGGKLTLVCAPAGFGRTTLLVEWLASLDCEARLDFTG